MTADQKGGISIQGIEQTATRPVPVQEIILGQLAGVQERLNGGTNMGHLKEILAANKSGIEVSGIIMEANPALREVLPGTIVSALESGNTGVIDMHGNAAIIQTAPRV